MSRKRRALIFANLRAGKARRFARPVGLLADIGIAVHAIHVDLSADAIKQALASGINEGIDMVIIFGGDGTVGTVFDTLAGCSLPFGIIPAGTSNNFARSLGLGAQMERAVQVIAEGGQQAIDLGRVNGHHFAHAAMIGLNVQFARQSQSLRPTIGRLSYPIAALRVYASRRSFSVHIQNGSAERSLDAFQVSVFAPRPFHEDSQVGADAGLRSSPLLRVTIGEDMSLPTVVKELPTIFFQRHLGLPATDSFETSSCRITSPQPLPLTLDGEIKTETPADVSLAPAAVRVFLPCGREP